MGNSYRGAQARLLMLCVAGTISVAATAAAETAPCETYAAEPVRVGVEPEALLEDSGMVAGRKHPDIFWTHNDSGNPFELFAQRIDGSIAARYQLTGGENVDIEDIAAGPCMEDQAQPCIYMADIGDNPKVRKEVAIYEIAEPARLESGTLAAKKLRFTYPDGPHNAEVLLADPHSGQLYVITKTPVGLGTVYRLEGLASAKLGYAFAVVHLGQAGIFGVLTTGGDVHPSGNRVLLRTYTAVFEYRGKPGQTLEQVLSATPVLVTGAPQRQGEAIAYTADGRGYVMGSEMTGSPIFRVDCAR
jgi:hypothetical protein